MRHATCMACIAEEQGSQHGMLVHTVRNQCGLAQDADTAAKAPSEPWQQAKLGLKEEHALRSGQQADLHRYQSTRDEPGQKSDL